MQQHNGIFDPEDPSVLGTMFDKAVTALPASMRTPENRTAIAKLILERAATSEAGLASLISLMDAISPAA
ncbi:MULTISPECIES: hypothetical protein [unclassified Bradyrhizobium]|uniref:hypothetical protein n=1 Tax=unclassified Bradyrhizobium TaxID=2631580 RepID=UPI00247A068D|nr:MULTISPECIES: hypothetical protein [unclassified Bradyrhizobium]WGS19084.1 hypothetical protein MTX22_32075 [Bradyrhizobium sp. ISRA463]WGS25921.1 hypothetical protein MTX19_29630 [Bradyrhizobium sp. ISRA464]